MLAFQTVMELRFGAIRAGWGELRQRQLERRVAELTVLQPDDRMALICAQLRADCARAGTPSGTSCPTVTAGSLPPPYASVCRSSPTTACSKGRLASSSSPPPSFEPLLTSGTICAQAFSAAWNAAPSIWSDSDCRIRHFQRGRSGSSARCSQKAADLRPRAYSASEIQAATLLPLGAGTERRARFGQICELDLRFRSSEVGPSHGARKR